MRRESKKCRKYIDEIMAENFPNLKKETDIQVQEAKRVPHKMNPKTYMLKYIIIKMAKVKERILKSAREKQSHIEGKFHKAIRYFFSRNFRDQKRIT